jgi:molecular chaperone GrpE (heat shock protein)
MSKDVKEGFTVHDRRFWAEGDGEPTSANQDSAPEPQEQEPELAREAPTPPVDVERLRAALAELEDTKIRVRRDAERQLEVLRARVLESLIPVLDNLERSIAASETAPSIDQLREGVKLIHSQFLAALERFGLERRSSVGTRFDPRVHDAIAVVPVADASQDGVVVSEVEPAYFMGDRVIRPAKVQVGRAADRPVA